MVRCLGGWLAGKVSSLQGGWLGGWVGGWVAWVDAWVGVDSKAGRHECWHSGRLRSRHEGRQAVRQAGRHEGWQPGTPSWRQAAGRE